MSDPQAQDAPPPGGRSFLARLGPSLITGAADEDPSGIGTHSQIGVSIMLEVDFWDATATMAAATLIFFASLIAG